MYTMVLCLFYLFYLMLVLSSSSPNDSTGPSALPLLSLKTFKEQRIPTMKQDTEAGIDVTMPCDTCTNKKNDWNRRKNECVHLPSFSNMSEFSGTWFWMSLLSRASMCWRKITRRGTRGHNESLLGIISSYLLILMLYTSEHNCTVHAITKSELKCREKNKIHRWPFLWK